MSGARAGEGPLALHPEMGAMVRAGSYRDHTDSTYDLAAAAVREGRGTDAASLARYTSTEALEAYELFTAWWKDIPAFLAGRGVAAERIAVAEGRLAALCTLPDGSSFDGDAGWGRYLGLIEEFATGAEAGSSDTAVLMRARTVWHETHDRLCDGVYFWLDVAARELGEDVIGELWDILMQPMYDYYDRYDTDNHPWPRSFDLLMHYALEGLRGHLSGPGRNGSVEVTEEEDRWALRFDPCGSGGRTMRDDPETGERPRMEAPWNLGVTTRKHDWAWNRTGVTYYCVHCCQLNQRMPMRRFGYPTRVVEPPTWPEARNGTKCTWYIYKDPSLVPDEVYRQVGAKKPRHLGGKAQKGARDQDRNRDQGK